MNEGDSVIISGADYAAYPDVGGRGKLKKRIILGVVGVLVVGLGLFSWLWLVPNLTGISRERAIEELSAIYEGIPEIESWLRYAINGDTSVGSASTERIDGIIGEFSLIRERCEEICDRKLSFASAGQSEPFESAMSILRARVIAYGPGVDALSKFNDAFFGVIDDIRRMVFAIDQEVDMDEILAWESVAETKALLSSGNGNIRAVAEKLDGYIRGMLPVLKAYAESNCESRLSWAAACGGLHLQLVRAMDASIMRDKTILKAILVADGDSGVIDYASEGYLRGTIDDALAVLRGRD